MRLLRVKASLREDENRRRLERLAVFEGNFAGIGIFQRRNLVAVDGEGRLKVLSGN